MLLKLRNNMENRRITIYNLLNGVQAGLNVYQERPEVIEIFPSSTYRISDDSNEYDLNKEVGKQNTEVIVDIWTETSIEGDELKILLENKMKDAGYLLSFSSDIIDPSGNSHITTRFNF